MRTRLVFLSLVLSCVTLSAESTGTWTPKILFQLEDGENTQTLIWISGWAYAVTEVERSNFKRKRASGVCLAQDQLVDSRTLVDVLNAKFAGQRISSEHASSALWEAVEKKYRCVSR